MTHLLQQLWDSWSCDWWYVGCPATLAVGEVVLYCPLVGQFNFIDGSLQFGSVLTLKGSVIWPWTTMGTSTLLNYCWLHFEVANKFINSIRSNAPAFQINLCSDVARRGSGTQFSSRLEFSHMMSSPHFPQIVGEPEKAVRTMRESTSACLALMAYCTNPHWVFHGKKKCMQTEMYEHWKHKRCIKNYPGKTVDIEEIEKSRNPESRNPWCGDKSIFLIEQKCFE